MWPFSKKTTIFQSGILRGATDHHSHILPGVDDGVESMDEALRILATYEAAGVKELWLTPHIMEDIPNTPEKLLTHFAELQAAYTGSITLHLAAEYMIDNHLRNLLSEVADRPEERVQETTSCHFEPKGEISTTKEKLLTIGKKHNHLLVETSYYNPPMRLHETLRQIKSLGYHPLLAHPERYMYMDKEEYIRLHQEGVKLQLNLPSICGGYGNTVKKRAQWLLNKGLYDVIGSDTHCEEGVEYLLAARIKEKELVNLSQIQSLIL
ncbi:MAG: capsular biosynthesis protein [Bacteroidaceae bacterium]|nr:capsular biosynthesis protein [Bacteroidaceae bacterium]